jgi:hypothetical protein
MGYFILDDIPSSISASSKKYLEFDMPVRWSVRAMLLSWTRISFNRDKSNPDNVKKTRLVSASQYWTYAFNTDFGQSRVTINAVSTENEEISSALFLPASHAAADIGIR